MTDTHNTVDDDRWDGWCRCTPVMTGVAPHGARIWRHADTCPVAIRGELNHDVYLALNEALVELEVARPDDGYQSDTTLFVAAAIEPVLLRVLGRALGIHNQPEDEHR